MEINDGELWARYAQGSATISAPLRLHFVHNSSYQYSPPQKTGVLQVQVSSYIAACYNRTVEVGTTALVSVVSLVRTLRPLRKTMQQIGSVQSPVQCRLLVTVDYVPTPVRVTVYKAAQSRLQSWGFRVNIL